MAACAVAAVSAPVAMAATVSNVHPLGVAAPAKYEDLLGTSNIVTLTSSGPQGVTLTDTDTITASDVVVAEGTDEDTCVPPPVAPPDGLIPWTCSLATVLNVNLGAGDDTANVGDDLLPVNLNGGAGSDTVDFRTSAQAKTVDLSAGTAGGGLALTSVENVNGGSGGDTITGTADRNVENGGGGNDALTGNDGPDVLNGGDGNPLTADGVNSLNGGDGDDSLTAGDGGDLLDGGPGADTFLGGNGNDTVVAADAAVDGAIDCGNGTNDTVVADLGPAGPVDTFKNCENIQGTVRPNTTTTTGAGTTTEVVQPVIFLPSLGTPPLTQVLAPGKADIADLTPPGAAMRAFVRQRIPTALARGVRVRVTCKEACGISVALSVDRATAKRLGLDTRTSPVVIGTASATRTVAGSSVLRVKVPKKVKTALKRSTRSVTTNFQVLVSDASGNGTLLSRHVTLVR